MGNSNSTSEIYEFNPEVQKTALSIDEFTLYQTRAKASLDKVTIFVHKKSSNSQFDLISTGLKTLKGIRHPGVIKYISFYESTEEVYIITSAVVPLKSIIKDFSEEDLFLGLYSLLDTLKFLDSIGVSHTNITIDSIFIGASGTENSTWLLGNFHYVIPSDEIKTTTTLDNFAAAFSKQWISAKDQNDSSSRLFVCIHNLLTTQIMPIIQTRSGTYDWLNFLKVLENDPSKGIESFAGNPFFDRSALIKSTRILRDFRQFPIQQKTLFLR